MIVGATKQSLRQLDRAYGDESEPTFVDSGSEPNSQKQRKGEGAIPTPLPESGANSSRAHPRYERALVALQQTHPS